MVDSIYKTVIFSDNTVFMTLQQCKLVYQVRDLKVIIGLKSTLPADNTATFRGRDIQHSSLKRLSWLIHHIHAIADIPNNVNDMVYIS